MKEVCRCGDHPVSVGAQPDQDDAALCEAVESAGSHGLLPVDGQGPGDKR